MEVDQCQPEYVVGVQEMADTVTVEEVARRLGIGRSLVYDLARRDALPVPVIRLGRRLVVSRVALDRLLEGNGSPPVQPNNK